VLVLGKVTTEPPWNFDPPGPPSGYSTILAGEYNSRRLRRYARLDMGWRRESDVSWFGGGVVAVYASVANLLNRANVVGWTVRRDLWGFERVSRRQLPVIPSLGAEFRF